MNDGHVPHLDGPPILAPRIVRETKIGSPAGFGYPGNSPYVLNRSVDVREDDVAGPQSLHVVVVLMVSTLLVEFG